MEPSSLGLMSMTDGDASTPMMELELALSIDWAAVELDVLSIGVARASDGTMAGDIASSAL